MATKITSTYGFLLRLVVILDYVMPDILNNDVGSVQPVDVAEWVDYERNY